jgi:hypothetical protein
MARQVDVVGWRSMLQAASTSPAGSIAALIAPSVKEQLEGSDPVGGLRECTRSTPAPPTPIECLIRDPSVGADAMKLRYPSSSAAKSKLIDAVMDIYITWREQAAAVESAYRAWTSAAAHERASAYASYAQALDCEELAANEYRRMIEQAGTSLALRNV